MVSVACGRGIQVPSDWLFEFSRGTAEPAGEFAQATVMPDLPSFDPAPQPEGEQNNHGAVDLSRHQGAANQWPYEAHELAGNQLNAGSFGSERGGRASEHPGWRQLARGPSLGIDSELQAFAGASDEDDLPGCGIR